MKIKNQTNKEKALVTRKMSLAQKLKNKPFIISLLEKRLQKMNFSSFSNKFFRKLQKKKKKSYIKKIRFKTRYRLGLYIENIKYRKKKHLFKNLQKTLLTKKYNSCVNFNKQLLMEIKILYSDCRRKKDNCNLEVFLW